MCEEVCVRLFSSNLVSFAHDLKKVNTAEGCVAL